MTEPVIPPVATWSWQPLPVKEYFEIALQIGIDHLITRIEKADRKEVAESLARLAQSVYPDPDVRLVWHLPPHND